MSTTPNPNTTTITTTTMTAAAVTSPSRPLTTVTAANTAGVRAQTPQAQSPSVTHPIQLFTSIPNQNPPQNQGRVYAFAPSPRGYAPRGFRPQQQDLPHPPHHAVGVSYRPTSTIGFNRSHPRPRPQFIFDDAHLSTHLIRPYPQLQHYMSGSGGGGNGGVFIPPSSVKGTPVSPQVKSAASPAPFPNSNGFKNLRDRSKEDTVITVRDRKVRITDGASLYALCRSWLRNGFPEDSQPHFGDVVKSLPRPLPIPIVDTDSPKNENEEVENNDVEEESIDQASTGDLLKRHVQRAKKVRARLREERLKRIARYKTRLALLLPPQLEQLKADAESGN